MPNDAELRQWPPANVQRALDQQQASWDRQEREYAAHQRRELRNFCLVFLGALAATVAFVLFCLRAGGHLGV